MWPAISELLKAASLRGHDYIDDDGHRSREFKSVMEWEEVDQYIFHLVVICNARMKDMLASLRFNATKAIERESIHEQRYRLNAGGLPCVHIAALLGRTKVVKRLLLQNPGISNEWFGGCRETVLHSAVRGNHMEVITYQCMRCLVWIRM